MAMVKMGILWLNFAVKFMMIILTMENMDFSCGHGQNFDHLTMVMVKNF